MSLEDFAEQLRIRRGRLSQAKLAVLSGVSESTIYGLDTKRGDAPQTSRNNVMDLAIAVGWDPDEALALVGYPPMTVADWTYVQTTAVRARLDRLWLRLSTAQRRALVDLMAAMVVIDPPPPLPIRTEMLPGNEITPGAGEIPGQSERGSSDR